MINESAQQSSDGKDNSAQNTNRVRRSRRSALSGPAADQPTAAAPPVTVLIVEDSPIVRERLAALIAAVRNSLIVGLAADGHQALALFRQHRPDAVVLDIELPGLDGIELLKQFKREHPPCLVIMLTTHSFKELKERCVALKADYFFDKFSEFEQVAEVLSTARSRRAVEGEL